MSIFADSVFFENGAVSEGFKETVLKTAVPQGTGGSNPPCSDLNHLVQGEVRERPNRAPC